MDLPLRDWIEKTAHVVTDSSVKTKLRTEWSVKMVTLIIFWNLKEPIISYFFKNGAAVNIASYWKLHG